MPPSLQTVHQSHLLVKGGDEDADNDDFPAFGLLFRDFLVVHDSESQQIGVQCDVIGINSFKFSVHLYVVTIPTTPSQSPPGVCHTWVIPLTLF